MGFPRTTRLVSVVDVEIEDFGVVVAIFRTRPTMSTTTDDQALPVPDGPVIPSEETTVEPLSKKAQKKAAKAARYAEQKAERRAREKERKKLKRAAAQPEPQNEDGAAPRSKRVKLDPSSRTMFGARLVIDLGFDDKMTEKVCPAQIAACCSF